MYPDFNLPRKYIYLIITTALLTGCYGPPKGFLKLSEEAIQKRNIQMRRFMTTDEKKILTAVISVLQDLGFTLAESESKLGLVVAYREADATNDAQVMGALLVDILSALGGTYSNYSSKVDSVQRVKASVIVRPAYDQKSIIVRANFQRIVWNTMGEINRVEPITNVGVYNKFFEALSKAIFLEEQTI